MPVKVFIMNNSSLGLVRQTQEELFEGRAFESSLLNPDFVKLANSYGIGAVRVQNLAEINDAINSAFDNREPFVVEFVVDENENV